MLGPSWAADRYTHKGEIESCEHRWKLFVKLDNAAAHNTPVEPLVGYLCVCVFDQLALFGDAGSRNPWSRARSVPRGIYDLRGRGIDLVLITLCARRDGLSVSKPLVALASINRKQPVAVDTYIYIYSKINKGTQTHTINIHIRWKIVVFGWLNLDI